jgi:hypothetical protein
MRFPPIPIEQIEDYPTQKAIQILRDWVRANSPLAGFRLFTATFTRNYDGSSTKTAYALPHNFGFVPQDIIITSQTGVGVAKFNQSLTDASNLYIDVSGNPTTAGPLVVRFLAGTYQGAL